MSNPISEDCSWNLHEYCTPCECKCHTNELEIALFCALVKIYDKYKTPLASNIRCYKSKNCPSDQIWDDNRFICWMEVLKLNGETEKFGYLILNKWWGEFDVIEFKIPNGLILNEKDVIKRLLEL